MLGLFLLGSGAWAADCPQHYAGGQPPVIEKAAIQARTRELCFAAFGLMHSGLSRGPLWSAEHLVRAQVRRAEDMVRKDSFHAEARLPATDRAELSDYARSGYDRGHMAPSGDMPDDQSQAESFSLANMVPQVHANNAGVWAAIEGAVRQLAVQEGEIYVVSGSAFVGSNLQSLKGRVLVPTHVWKVVYSPKRKQAGVYLVTNDETKSYTSLTVSELQQMIGIQALPGVSKRVRDSGMELPVPYNPRNSRAAKKPRSTPEDTPPVEFSLGEFARRVLEKLLGALAR